MTKDEALKLALAALETCVVYSPGTRFQIKNFDEVLITKSIKAIKALAQTSDSVAPVADYWVLDNENTFAEVVSFDSFREAKQAASDHGCGLLAYHRTLTRIDATQTSDDPCAATRRAIVGAAAEIGATK